jgi:thiol-disulfide isomerase/thioredoxin
VISSTKLSHLVYALALFLFILSGCGSSLRQGGSTLGSIDKPIGLSPSGEPLILSNYKGKPLLVYVRADWCPSCRDIDKALSTALKRTLQAGEVQFVILESESGRTLSKEKTSHLNEAGAKVGSHPGGEYIWEGEKRYRGNARRINSALSLKRIPALIGFYQTGALAGALYGYQTDMESKIEGLADKIRKERDPLKEGGDV